MGALAEAAPQGAPYTGVALRMLHEARVTSAQETQQLLEEIEHVFTVSAKHLIYSHKVGLWG